MTDPTTWQNDPIVLLEKSLYPLLPLLLRAAAHGQPPDGAALGAMTKAAEGLRRLQVDHLDGLHVVLSNNAEGKLAAFADLLDAHVCGVASTAPGDIAQLSDVDYLAVEFADRLEATLDVVREGFLVEILDRQDRAQKASEIAAREVTAISRQIYFISINASVEAARAGEAGRGFAVIGEQIRSLSQDAAQALRRMSKQQSLRR